MLVPIAINNTWKITQYGYYPLNTFERMTWEVLAPIEPDGKLVEELVKEAEDRIKKALGLAPLNLLPKESWGLLRFSLQIIFYII